MGVIVSDFITAIEMTTKEKAILLEENAFRGSGELRLEFFCFEPSRNKEVKIGRWRDCCP